MQQKVSVLSNDSIFDSLELSAIDTAANATAAALLSITLLMSAVMSAGDWSSLLFSHVLPQGRSSSAFGAQGVEA